MSKSIWQQLGIPAGSDKAVIRRAYANRLRQTNPEDDPEGFKLLRAAYEQALRLAGQSASLSGELGSTKPCRPRFISVPDTSLDSKHGEAASALLLETGSAPDASRQAFDAAAARVTSLLQSEDAAASEELPDSLKRLLAQPELEQIGTRGAIEQWLAFQIASNFPRSDPIVNTASYFFGWDAPDYRARSPAIGAVLNRREVWTQIAAFNEPDHSLHAGWLALSQDGLAGWRRRLQAIRPERRKQVGVLIDHVGRTGLQDYAAPSAVQWWRAYLERPRPEQALPLLPLCWLQALASLCTLRGSTEVDAVGTLVAIPIGLACSLAYVLLIRPAISLRIARPDPRRAQPELAIALLALLVVGMMLPFRPWSLLVGDGLVTALLCWQGFASTPNAPAAIRPAVSRPLRFFILFLPCLVLAGTVDTGGRLLWALIAVGLATAWFRGSGTIIRTLFGWKPWPRRCLLITLTAGLITFALYAPSYLVASAGSYRVSLALLGCWGLLTLFAAFESATFRALIVPAGYIVFILVRVLASAPLGDDYVAPAERTSNTASPVQSFLPTATGPARQFVCPKPTAERNASAPAIACSPGEWIASEDYPAAALLRQSTGRVSIVGSVGIQGSLLTCMVEKSSGDAELDHATCSLLLRRARFIPAHDKHGRSVEGTWRTRVSWQLPS